MQATLIKISKTLARAFVFLVVLILFYLGVGFCLSRISVEEEKNAPDQLAIYILTNGVHTDLVLPVKTDQIDWSKKVKFQNIASKDSLYSFLALGWGDKGFYLETPEWKDLKPRVAFKAATGLSSSAMHATYYKTMVENENCKKILISKNQYQRLIQYIDQSFQKDPKGDYIYIQTNANYGVDDAFYQGVGSYSIFKTCNSWANDGLKASGQKAALWTPFDTGIFLNYP